jgi:uncharacterized protein
MDYNVSQLLREPIGATRDIRIDEIVSFLIDGKPHRIYGDCNLLRSDENIIVNCSLETEIELTCSRCLRTFIQPLKIKFAEEFVPTLDVLTGAHLAPPEDPAAFTIDERHILDLTEAVRQYAVMATPMKAVCKKSCAGLCAKCGKNLNEGKCGCPEDNIDPRWAKLADLK